MRNELHAAMCLMEHRECWWAEGMHNSESEVGMEIGRVRNGEMLAAEEMNAQMTSLVETLRTAQHRAEQSTLAALSQQRIAFNRNPKPTNWRLKSCSPA